MINTKKYLSTLFIYFTVFMGIGTSQNLINNDINHIEHKEYLHTFYDSLNKKSAVILHIGDSHIQANLLTGRLRELFQNKYGNAGRGIVFPLELAKTNAHSDIRFSSNVYWERNRIIDSINSKVGIAGATILTKEPDFYIKLNNHDDLDISEIKIIGEGLAKLQFGIPTAGVNTTLGINKGYYIVKKGNTLNKIAKDFNVSVTNIKRWNNLKNDNILIGQKLRVNRVVENTAKLDLSNFRLISPIVKSNKEIKIKINENFKNLYIISQKEDSNIDSFTKIDGIFLSNNKQGVVYHSIGINGAKYIDYNKSDLFFKELEYIHPDLIIVSLGTNEAFDKKYIAEDFYSDADFFLKKVKKITGCDNILITTPPSSLINRSKPNPKLKLFTQDLIDIANKNNYAIWNLYNIMGKEKGMINWYSKGFAKKDKIHFIKKGYLLQAKSLFKALTE